MFTQITSQIAETFPAACKHLLHAAVRLCREYIVVDPAYKLLSLYEAFGVQLRNPGAADAEKVTLAWLSGELPAQDRASSARLRRLLKDLEEGKLARFGLVAKDDYVEELRVPTLAARRRLEEFDINV